MRHLLPGFILENLQANRYRGQFAAATLFIDLSGYTATTEVLMQHGQAGAETIGELIRDLFRPIIQSVFTHYGFIAQAEGDALTAIFPEKAQPSNENGSAPAFACQRAALAAAIAVQQHIHNQTQHVTPFGAFTFAVKVGLGYGTVEWGILESLEATRHTYYVKGSAIHACTQAEQLAEGGEIILSPMALAALAPLLPTWQEMADGHGRLLPVLPEIPVAAALPTIPPPDLTLGRTFFPSDQHPDRR